MRPRYRCLALVAAYLAIVLIGCGFGVFFVNSFPSTGPVARTLGDATDIALSNEADLREARYEWSVDQQAWTLVSSKSFKLPVSPYGGHFAVTLASPDLLRFWIWTPFGPLLVVEENLGTYR